tara:strand:- start:72 stop:416 length:345 start_codon:yes stop_codon:yes gene_type:complete
MYRYTDDKHGIRQIELIEFDENEHYDTFIAEVSEIAWGDSGTYTDAKTDELVCPRPPYGVSETLERLRKDNTYAHAWIALSMWCGAGDHPVNDDTDEKMNLRELMDDILKEAKQ